MIAPLPVATYRLQLTPQFGFDAAADIVSYLKSLGISHLYASPFFKARTGSTHGYDIVDHTAFNPELGGEVAFLRLSDALARADMGLIVDFVPNHMCVEGVRNEWWWNTLEFGPHGRHAAHFDISWDALPGRPRVLLPILGRTYWACLEAGEIQLEYDGGAFSVAYFDHRFPVRPESYGAILRTLAGQVGDVGVMRELIEVAARHELGAGMSEEHAEALKASLASVKGGEEIVRRGLVAYQARMGAVAAMRLHRLLERQHYRLAFWRVAGSVINYRRFFDINSLAGLRVERPETFDALHPLVARLLKEGRLQGLRIDHIDGLFDPADYCRRLEQLFREHTKVGTPAYLVVEKILGEGETLPPWTGVAGTTGYEWMNAMSRVLVEGRGLERLEQCWREVSPARPPFDDILRAAKSQVLDTLFAGEFNVLAKSLARIAAGHRATRDYPADRLRQALRAYIIELPVYRTYAADTDVSVTDRSVIDRAIAGARNRWTGGDDGLFDFLRETLTLDLVRQRSGHSAARVRLFVMKLQQLTGPVMAKSLEDTSLYRDHRLLALNEVGNDPTLPPLTVADFHARILDRCSSQPHGLTTTATHDTKRGEDARMRILGIAELADEWCELVDAWRSQNEQHLELLDGRRVPSPEHEYMLYQAMIGSWPVDGPAKDFVQRLCEYAVKAAREGKVESSWLHPDESYEAALQGFISRILDRDRSPLFFESFAKFAERCALLGALYSLSQLTLKTMMPGVPDFYQGSEFWDLSFVDPDNRRPVDFQERKMALQKVANPAQETWQGLTRHWRDGRIKLALTAALLRLRQQNACLFTEGSYSAAQLDTDDAIGFTRARGSEVMIVLAARRFAQATDRGRRWPDPAEWSGSVELPGELVLEKSLLGSLSTPALPGHLPLAELFEQLPIAVLHLRSL